MAEREMAERLWLHVHTLSCCFGYKFHNCSAVVDSLHCRIYSALLP